MTALTESRDTPERVGAVVGYPVAAAVNCHQGGIAALNAGYVAPATTATGLVAVGRFEESYDNSTGAAGAVTLRVREGVFRYANSAAADALAQADVGADCYLVDDATVAKTDGAGTRPACSRVALDSILGTALHLSPAAHQQRCISCGSSVNAHCANFTGCTRIQSNR